MTKIIGICGGSGSGKTTLAKKLKLLRNSEISILSMDNYYFPQEQQSKDKNGVLNFDLPSALNIELLINHLEQLRNGDIIHLAEYTFNNPNAQSKTQSIHPSKYILCEGIFMLQDKGIRDLLDKILFIDADESVMFSRRFKRDSHTRGIKPQMINYQWNNHFLPAYHKYVLPYKEWANYLVDGNQPFNIQEIEMWLN